MNKHDEALAMIAAFESYWRRFKADEAARANGDVADPMKTGLQADRGELADAIAQFLWDETTVAAAGNP